MVAGAARGRRRRVGHRLLVAHPRLHDLLRLPRRARPRARRGDRAQGRAARAHRARRRRRRRRLLDRRQPLPARVPAQRRPDLHRDGQPRLRHDQGPALADHRARLGLEALAGRHRRALVPSARHRARVGRQFRRARVLRRSERHRRRSSRRRSAIPASRSSRSCRPCVTFRPEQREWKELAHPAPVDADRRPGARRAPDHDRRRLQHRRALRRRPQAVSRRSPASRKRRSPTSKRSSSYEPQDPHDERREGEDRERKPRSAAKPKPAATKREQPPREAAPRRAPKPPHRPAHARRIHGAGAA